MSHSLFAESSATLQNKYSFIEVGGDVNIFIIDKTTAYPNLL